MNPQESIGYLIKTTARAMANFINRRIKEAGMDLTMDQAGVLIHLAIKDGQNQQDLSDTMCKDKTTTTRIIGIMEKRGLIVRVADKTDKRNRLMYLTNTGRETYAELTKIISTAIPVVTGEISPPDLETTKKVLRKIQLNADSTNL